MTNVLTSLLKTTDALTRAPQPQGASAPLCLTNNMN